MKLRPRSVATELTKLRTSLGTLLKMSYFITSEMGADLSASQLRGTLPLLYVFLARTGKTIHEVSFVDLAPDGSLQSAADAKSGARGVKIVFSGNDAKPQTLYYFRTDLSNRGVQTSGFLQFCAQFGVGDIFIKAASYLLHNAGFSTVRDFLLGQRRFDRPGRYGHSGEGLPEGGMGASAVRPVRRADPHVQRQLSIEAQRPVREGRGCADRFRHRLSVAHQSIACAAGGEQELLQRRDRPPRRPAQEAGGEKKCAARPRSLAGGVASCKVGFAAHGRADHRGPGQPVWTAGSCQCRSASFCRRPRSAASRG